jgi:prepilin-type N-terminal cleavage/methylation domain-containing protein
MARSKPARTRAAFTLIELLIAILIIGILATLVTLGVSKAMTYAKQVATKTEMAQIEQAQGVAAIEMGRVPYIPSYLVLKKTPGEYAGATDPYMMMSGRILMQMFPGWTSASWCPTGGTVVLDATQTYVFFLNGNNGMGFSKGMDPWDTSGNGKKFGPYFQFKSERLIPATWNPSSSTFPAYSDYWDNKSPYIVYSQMMVGSGNPPVGAGGAPPETPTAIIAKRQLEGVKKYYMPKGYQIFSAGKDGAWGNLGYNVTPFNGLVKNADGSEADDQANFSESPLGKPIND